ncbi:MAG TPA: hypothetical protein PLY51_11985 [Microthrixaceae bacterium]|nr:hypothetical protein [Myxococcota bacterium]HNH96280.1 hypothetical protein [Microthrixaceae bacterium]
MADVGSYRAKVLIDNLGGTVVDASSRIEGDIVWTAGRPTRYDDVAAATCTVTLRNGDGYFTPGNTTSALYATHPALRGKGLTVKITSPAGVETQIFAGYIDTVEVDTMGDPDLCLVTIKASDVMARFGRITLDDLFIQTARATSYSLAGGCDVFRMQAGLLNNDSAGTLTVFENRGKLKAGNASLGTLRVVPTTVPRDAGIVGALDVEAADSQLSIQKFTITPVPKTVSGWTGPVLKYVPQGQMDTIAFHFRCPDDFVVANGTNHERVLVDFLASGVSKMQIRVSLYQGTMALTAMVGATVYLLSSAGDPTDGAWRHISVTRNTATQWGLEINDNGSIGLIPGVGDLRAINQVVFGGQFNTSDGGQSKVCPASFAGIEANDVSGTYVPRRFVTGSPVATSAVTWLNELMTYDQQNLSGYPTAAALGTTAYNVVRPATEGRTLLDCVQELGRSQNGYVFVDPTGVVTQVRANASIRTTSIGTITLDEDDDSTVPIVWRDGVDQNLTRVYASCPLGTATVINTAAESAGSFNDLTITTCNATIANLTTVAQAYVTGPVSLAPSQIAVDLLTAQNRTTLWSGFFVNLRPGAKFVVAGMPAAIFGVTSKNLYAEGWTATFSVDQAQFVIDCSEAP